MIQTTNRDEYDGDQRDPSPTEASGAALHRVQTKRQARDHSAGKGKIERLLPFSETHFLSPSVSPSRDALNAQIRDWLAGIQRCAASYRETRRTSVVSFPRDASNAQSD